MQVTKVLHVCVFFCLEKKNVCACVHKNEHKCKRIQTKLNLGKELDA